MEFAVVTSLSVFLLYLIETKAKVCDDLSRYRECDGSSLGRLNRQNFCAGWRGRSPNTPGRYH
jgi:hypothetical protein